MPSFIQPTFNSRFPLRACHILLLSTGLLPALVQAAPVPNECGAVTVTEPSSTKIDNNHPHIAWRPVSGASAYRIKLESRIPEGEKVFSAEVQLTAPNFFPAKPLTESRAHVRAAITPICGSREGAPTIYQFDIDTGAACGTDSDITLGRDGGKRQLRWVAPKSAQSHNVWVYAMDSGKLLSNAEVIEARWVFPDELASPAIIAIRPKCASGQGRFSYLAF